MKYELYHDESKHMGFWHGILLVPVKTKKILLEYLESARSYQKYSSKISFKKIRKSKGQIYWIADSWIQIGVASFMQKITTKEGIKHAIFSGNIINGSKEYNYFNNLIKAKFILFREKDAHKK